MRFAQTVNELLDAGRGDAAVIDEPESSANKAAESPGPSEPGGEETPI
jgi:hypothetical protein